MRTARKRGAALQATEHHRLLGVPEGADLETVKRAYRHLAREVHPDINPDDPQAADRFQKLTVAYETLAAHAPPPSPDPEPEPEPESEPDEHTSGGTTSGTGASDAAPPSPGHGAAAGPTDATMPGPAARPRHNIFAATPPSGGATPPDESPPPSRAGRPPPSTPRAVELPRPLADAAGRFLLLAPALWAVAGFPGLAGNGLAVGPLQVAVGTVLVLVGWVLTGALLWSRAPSVPRQLPWWRSPGWDGTGLAVRLLLFYALVVGSTALFLTPHLDDGDAAEAPSWTLGLWLVLVMAAWVISGRLPAQLGYQSRFERYWRLTDTGLPRQVFRMHPTDLDRKRARPRPQPRR